MNELGLTREFIREMATDLVTAEVEKAVKNMEHNGILEKIIRYNLDNIIRQSRGNGFCYVMTEAFKEVAVEWVKENVTISKKPDGESPCLKS